ncbi:MAG: 2-oxoacid:ferredoxin oxidoreductase subunit beta [Candidatus Brocadiales bacterium]
MVELKDYQGGETAWCPGCGNFMLLRAVEEALVGLGLEPHEVLLVSGIGQSSKLPHYMKCNTFNSLHGRTLSPATGAKLANHELAVIAIAGDGDCYGEGGNHFLHTIRRNVNVTIVVHNNQVYGLTKGQASPTSEPGFVTKVQPGGVFESAFNPLGVAIALNAGFVARGFVGEKAHLVDLIQRAVRHKGFALVDVLQNCPSFNKLNTFKWYKDRAYKLDDKDYDPADRMAAFQKAQEWGDRIPLGLIYNHTDRPAMEEQEPVIAQTPLVKQPIDCSGFDKLLEEFY